MQKSRNLKTFIHISVPLRYLLCTSHPLILSYLNISTFSAHNKMLSRADLRGGSERWQFVDLYKAYLWISDHCRVIIRVSIWIGVGVRIRVGVRDMVQFAIYSRKRIGPKTDRCRPTNSVKALKGKYRIQWICLPQNSKVACCSPSSPGVFQLCLEPLLAPGYYGGGRGVATSLFSPLMPVPQT